MSLQLIEVALTKASSADELRLLEEMRALAVALEQSKATFIERLHANRRCRGEEVRPLTQRQLAIIKSSEVDAETQEKHLKQLKGMSLRELLQALAMTLDTDEQTDRAVHLSNLPRADRPLILERLPLYEGLRRHIESIIGPVTCPILFPQEKSGSAPGPALFIAARQPVTDFDIFLNGKAVGAALQALDEQCAALGVKTLSSMAVFFEEADSWFSPSEGLAAVEALLGLLRKHPRKLKGGTKAICADLTEYQEVLSYLQKRGIDFRFVGDD